MFCFCFVDIFKLICTHVEHIRLVDTDSVNITSFHPYIIQHKTLMKKHLYPNDVHICLFAVGIHIVSVKITHR